ncbi:MAG: hypothetical protein QM756_24550 [Polyangiaceae bacterium]
MLELRRDAQSLDAVFRDLTRGDEKLDRGANWKADDAEEEEDDDAASNEEDDEDEDDDDAGDDNHSTARKA